MSSEELFEKIADECWEHDREDVIFCADCRFYVDEKRECYFTNRLPHQYDVEEIKKMLHKY